jgi:hypothetical protein
VLGGAYELSAFVDDTNERPSALDAEPPDDLPPYRLRIHQIMIRREDIRAYSAFYYVPDTGATCISVYLDVPYEALVHDDDVGLMLLYDTDRLRAPDELVREDPDVRRDEPILPISLHVAQRLLLQRRWHDKHWPKGVEHDEAEQAD